MTPEAVAARSGKKAVPVQPKKLAAGAVLLALTAWIFWPSPLANLTNLRSRGSSLIAFGDSLTAGYGATLPEAYPARLSSMIGAEVINAGVSGDTTESARERLDRDVLSREPRIVIVGLGGNDFLRAVAIAETESNLRTIVRKIHSAGSMVVLLGYRFPSFKANYEAMYERVAEEEGALLIPDLLDGITSNRALKSDEIHPNARGYQLMAERIAGPLRKLIGKADSLR
ncbi:MAG TPA: arylesterase [Thermoanaerobaculia bacterium]|nr:arylesterase [Thermoanaerobaculia bacterium]